MNITIYAVIITRKYVKKKLKIFKQYIQQYLIAQLTIFSVKITINIIIVPKITI